MKKYIIALLSLFAFCGTKAQQKMPERMDRFMEFTGTMGNREGTASFAYMCNWRMGKLRKLELGLGLRSIVYSGKSPRFYTAPARLTRSSSFPILTIFSAPVEKNIDTLNVFHPFTGSMNLVANLGYNLNSKWSLGMNIDLVGFTIGKKALASKVSNGNLSSDPGSKPANFNLLLSGDNDRGSLDSEFFIRYRLNQRWKIKAAYQFYFSEYTTQNMVQVAPDGSTNNRFRNKVNAFGLGLSYDL